MATAARAIYLADTFGAVLNHFSWSTCSPAAIFLKKKKKSFHAVRGSEYARDCSFIANCAQAGSK
jgi:hypothetical protein